MAIRPRTHLPTHEVSNQVPPWEGHDLFSSDACWSAPCTAKALGSPKPQPSCVSEHSGVQALQLQRLENAVQFGLGASSLTWLPIHNGWKLITLDGFTRSRPGDRHGSIFPTYPSCWKTPIL